ncbi:MAG: hypothetical protein R3286_10130 [Gammaproteobacteria bacterium]|nr:hypothetical protein [Gammaproteobacteria bacterium]
MAPHVAALAEIARTSPEYQGHGWGCAWLEDEGWRLHHDIAPIWEATPPPLGSSRLLLVHARSAFRDEGIRIENNMPFFDGERVFVFNGELRGVRIREQGRIGAEKLFNYVKRFDKGDTGEAIRRCLGVVEKKTRYVRAMNFVLADRASCHYASWFNEDPDYFQLHRKAAHGLELVCSAPYPGEDDWERVANHSVGSI